MSKKIKNIVFIIIGIIIGGSLSVIASNVISANQVGFSSNKTNKTNLQDALNEIYDKTNKQENTTNIWKYEGVKAIVYLDPTDLSKNCNSNNSVSTPGTKTGCMKWYVYNEDDTSYTMILDHNTTAYSYYNYDNINTVGTRSSSELTLENGTTISYNEVGYDLNGLISTSHWVVEPRLITVQEIANITGNTTWTSGAWFYLDNNSKTQVSTKKGESKYAWLFDYTKSCTSRGCNVSDNSTSGYWTSTLSKNSNSEWRINFVGNLNLSSFNDSSFGIRPVITVLKSKIS